MITIKPLEGLGNRLRVINSALSIAEQEELPIHVIWQRYKMLDCPYRSLFKPSIDIKMREVKDSYALRFYKKLLEPMGLSKLKSLKYDLVLGNKEVYRLVKKGVNFKGVNSIKKCID